MPPRNSRLSAYYNLPPASPTLPKTRDEGLSHADNLTKTLPLQQLLTHATNQKNRYDQLRTQLHSATLSHYQHLQSALQTAELVHQQAEQLNPDTECISRAIELSRAIHDSLAETRKLVKSLEAVRRVEQLATAAGILIDQFPKLADQLPLCTDPQHLHSEIFLAAHRYSCIRPAVGKLASVDKSLQRTVESLDTAAGVLSKSLNNEQTVLGRGDIARVRLLLSDDRSVVEHDFVTSVVEDVLHRRVSEKALSGTCVDRSITRLVFFTDHVFETLLKDAQVYEEVFGECVWVNDVVYDALAEIRDGLQDVLDHVPAVGRLRECLKKLTERDEVGRSGADSIEKVIRDVALVEAEERVRALVKDVEGLEKGAILQRVNDLREKLVAVLQWDANKVESFFGRGVSEVTDVRDTAAGAALCQVLLRDGWNVVRIRDICVERSVESVLQQLRHDLNGDQKFVQVVRYVHDIGRRFDIEGLVDDDLGEGFGHRVLGGAVEIIREMGLTNVHVEIVERIMEGVRDCLDIDALKVVVDERRFD